MDKQLSGISGFLARFRGWIQAIAALGTNIHLPNFFKGTIYQGKGKVVCVPGDAFGQNGAGHIRCCYATAMDHMLEAFERMGRFIRSL